MMGTCPAAANLRHSSPGHSVPSLPLSQESQARTLCSAQSPAHQSRWVGSHSPFSVTLSFPPVQLDSAGPNCAFTLVSLLAELLHVPAESHISSSFKRVSIWPPPTASWIPGLVLCGLHLLQSTKSLSVRAAHSLPMPSIILGDRVSLWNPPSWHCSYGHPTRRVCAA